MKFQWNPKKAPTNLAKHSVDFADATGVFFDEMAITILDPDSDEERFITLGADPMNRILVVVYTWRGEEIRIISARKASRMERLEYEGAR